MKKLLLTTVACATLAAGSMAFADDASAQNATTDNQYFNGFYVGAGASNMNFHNDYSEEIKNLNFQPSGGASPIKIDDLKLDLYGGSSVYGLNINAGYGKQMGKWYVGGDIKSNVNFNNDNVIKEAVPSLGQATAHSNMPISFTAAAQFGYVVSPRILTYVGVGGNYGKYTQGTSGVGSQAQKDTSYWLFSFMPSIGVKMAASQHLMLDVNYSMSLASQAHTDKIPGGEIIPGKLSFDSATSKFTPSFNAIMLNAEYRF